MRDSSVEIVGFRFPWGYLDYSGGLLTIYGRNGAGKSLLLEAIESSLAGLPVGRTSLETSTRHWERVSVATVVRTRFVGLEQFYAYDEDQGLKARFEAALELADYEVSRLGLPAPLLEAWGALHQTLAEGDFAVVAPTGAVAPQWTAHAASPPGSVAAEEWTSELREHIDSFASDDGNSYDAWATETDEQFTIEEQVTGLDGLADDGGVYRFNPVTQKLLDSPFGRVITESTIDLQAAVDQWLKGTLRDHADPDVREDGGAVAPEEISAALVEIASAWTHRANDLYRRFLLDPPELRLALGDPLSWVSGMRPHWQAGAAVQVNDLSDAEKRWARIAIALTTPDDIKVLVNDAHDDSETFATDLHSDLEPLFLVMDEPERGLHRAAEAHMADGLLALAATGRVRPIIATHSPSLLDAGQGQVVHLARAKTGGGIGELHQLTPSELEDLRQLDLNPSSLLDSYRGYLLVEGEHDKQILEGWFADDLRALRVEILAMRGTNNLLTIFDSELLLQRTDATLMPLLDDIAIEPLHDLWAKAEARVNDSLPSDAVGVIRQGMSRIPGGATAVYEPLLTGSITRGVSHRFFPLGMSKKDVLQYLPVGDLVDGAASWTDLREEYSRSPLAMHGRGSGKAYKDWLRDKKRADFSPENLRLVAETTQPHPDLKAVIARIAERLS